MVRLCPGRRNLVLLLCSILANSATCFSLGNFRVPNRCIGEPSSTATRGITWIQGRSQSNHHPFAVVSSSSSSRRFLAGPSSSSAQGCSSLPRGISPFERSASKSLDIQGEIRKLARSAIAKASRDGKTLMELEFPPSVGGDRSKTQFDDLDNISELDSNRDWCVQFAPTLKEKNLLLADEVWLIFPDDKETELAKREWKGTRYRSAGRFTSIRAALTSVCGGEEQVSKAWGSNFASAMNKLQGGDGILGDSSTLDSLDSTIESRLHLICQPGNGGPVEDWINVEKLHRASGNKIVSLVVNGALDKVRNGYYPSLFFPALAATVPFYRDFEAVFWLKPISDQGLYGWLYRVYPEPWQVILQSVVPENRGTKTITAVKDTVALVSKKRPSYQESVNALVQASKTLTSKRN